MTAALSLLHIMDAAPAKAPLILPRELAEVLSDSPRSLAVFERLDGEQRMTYCAYVAEAALPATRERRAALVAMSLAGLTVPRSS
jgi:uncharacterized protein YdeI (YjbR/CyaY-like superfamily)